ncbi:MAG: hypothetical protein HY319_07825 [Armatimonadetes bacterium]|nr:hypothetical protein [Armatimonadota bacterium]
MLDHPGTAHSRGRRRLAARQGRRLARRLQGLPAREVLELSREFIANFLDELFRRREIGTAALIELAQVPLDLVLKTRTGEQTTEV